MSVVDQRVNISRRDLFAETLLRGIDSYLNCDSRNSVPRNLQLFRLRSLSVPSRRRQLVTCRPYLQGGGHIARHPNGVNIAKAVRGTTRTYRCCCSRHETLGFDKCVHLGVK